MLQQLTGILIAILVVLTVRHTFTYTKSKRNVRRGTQPNIFYLRSHFSLHHQLTHLIKLWIFPFRTYTPKKRMKNILLKCWYTEERYNHIRTQTEWKEKSCHSLQMSLFQNIFSIVESIIHLKLCRPVLIQFCITLKAFGTMRTSHTLMHHIRCTFSLSFYSILFPPSTRSPSFFLSALYVGLHVCNKSVGLNGSRTHVARYSGTDSWVQNFTIFIIWEWTCTRSVACGIFLYVLKQRFRSDFAYRQILLYSLI